MSIKNDLISTEKLLLESSIHAILDPIFMYKFFCKTTNSKRPTANVPARGESAKFRNMAYFGLQQDQVSLVSQHLSVTRAQPISHRHETSHFKHRLFCLTPILAIPDN